MVFFDAAAAAIALVGLGPLLLTPLVLRHGARFERSRQAFEAALREVGAARGAEATVARWWTHQGVDLCVDLHVPEEAATSGFFTRVRARHAELPRSLRIFVRGAPGAREGRVRVGDPELDAVAAVAGEPEAAVLARMTPSTRATVAGAVRRGGRYRDGTWAFLVPGVITDPATLAGIVDLAVGATWALVGTTPAASALRERVDDPVPGVAARALELAVLADPPDEWLSWMSTSRDPRRALLAAAARGERGRERLWWVVDLGDSPFRLRAALALAALPPDERLPDLEAVLVRSLDDPRRDVIDLLARIATVRAVPALRVVERAGGPLVPAARAAVRAIQARATGEAGGLALAEPRGGELAEAEGPPGRLALAPDRR